MSRWKWVAIGAYVAVLVLSFAFGFGPGMTMGKNLLGFAEEMGKILPAAFLLIGLLDEWVPRAKVEELLGRESGLKGHLLAFVIAAPFAGGLYVSLPVAAALYEKGASLEVVLTFLGASTLVRIPMMIFEASFMGIGFTLARLAVSVPLVIGSSFVLARLIGPDTG